MSSKRLPAFSNWLSAHCTCWRHFFLRNVHQSHKALHIDTLFSVIDELFVWANVLDRCVALNSPYVSPRPSKITVSDDKLFLNVVWKNSESTKFPSDYLRGKRFDLKPSLIGVGLTFSKAANNKISQGSSNGVMIDTVELVGGYALSIKFSDGHNEGFDNLSWHTVIDRNLLVGIPGWAESTVNQTSQAYLVS